MPVAPVRFCIGLERVALNAGELTSKGLTNLPVVAACYGDQFFVDRENNSVSLINNSADFNQFVNTPSPEFVVGLDEGERAKLEASGTSHWAYANTVSNAAGVVLQVGDINRSALLAENTGSRLIYDSRDDYISGAGSIQNIRGTFEGSDFIDIRYHLTNPNAAQSTWSSLIDTTEPLVTGGFSNNAIVAASFTTFTLATGVGALFNDAALAANTPTMRFQIWLA